MTGIRDKSAVDSKIILNDHGINTNLNFLGKFKCCYRQDKEQLILGQMTSNGFWNSE